MTTARWSDLRARALSAGLLAPFALLCLWTGGWVWDVLIAALGAGVAVEWRRLCRRSVGSSRARLATGLALIAVAVLALIWLRADAVAGRANVLFLVVVIWATDIGAYVAGRTLGGPRLAPAISPGKTWAGALGGVGCAALTGAACAAILGHGGWWAAGAVAAVLSVAGQAGDLLESAMKRHAGVKDTGGLIPGHGGLLDRLDGMLTAAPVAAMLALAQGRGVVLWQ